MRIRTRRRMARWTSAGVGAATLGMLLIAPAGAAPAPRSGDRAGKGDKHPPPPQMRSLYAMLGKFTCPEKAEPGQPAEEGYMTGSKGLGGHFLDTRVDIPGVLHGRGTMGWNPVDKEYFAFYADDWGSTSTATSKGWKDGHLVFTGPIVQVLSPDPSGNAKGVRMTLTNDYRLIDRDHYTVVQTISVPDGPTVRSTFECRRV